MSTLPGRTSIFDDPALVAMGLVPARHGTPDGIPGGSAAAASWRAAWCALALGLLAIIGLFWSTLEQAVSVWYRSASFNHAFLILPICFYLIWLKRGALANQVPRPTWWGLGIIALAGFGWLMGHFGSVVTVQQFAVVILVQGLFLSVLGFRIAWLLAFPLLYMFFAVPAGLFLIAPLQDLTAYFVVKGLQIISIPVFLDGIFLTIPTGSFEVAETCSGVRFLIATVALGTLFAHLTYRSYWRQAAFIALSFIVPIIANGFRAFGIVWLAYISDNEIAVGVDHIVYGWIFFAFVTVVLLLIGMTFRDGAPLESAPDADAIRRSSTRAVSRRRIGLTASVALLASAIAPAYAGHISARPVPSAPGALPAPAAAGGWQVTSATRTNWSPVFPAAHAVLQRQYAKGSKRVDLFIAYYATQRHGAELISSKNRVSDTWARAAGGPHRAVVDGRTQAVDRMRLIYRGRDKRVVYRWYWIGGSVTASPYLAKVLQATGQLLAGDEPAATVIISAPYDELAREADDAIGDFLKSVQPISPFLREFARRG